MRLLLAVASLVLLAVVGAASASHQDPAERLTKADTARAQAMLLRKGDLPPGFQLQPAPGQEPHVDCDPSVSQADLTLTGNAEGRTYALLGVSVGSSAQVYESGADARASWRRGTSAKGVKCLSDLLRREFGRTGVVTLTSFRKVSFPRITEQTVAYRARLSASTDQGPVPVYADVVVLARSRAHAQAFFGSVLVPPDRAAELRLSRLVAKRMAAAMRNG